MDDIYLDLEVNMFFSIHLHNLMGAKRLRRG